MKYVVVDLEMNGVSKQFREARRICRQEIIEIGAVLLNERFEEIDSFVTLVRPRFNTVVEQVYAKLTGIDTQMVQDAPKFETAVSRFFDWCLQVGDDIRLVEWSENDLIQIRRELRQKDCSLSERHMPLMEKWMDFQQEFDEKLGLERCVSLSDALMYAGIDFEGRQHDALFDARNTANLMRVVNDPELCRKTLDKVVEVFHPEPMGTAMGELFDFGKLGFSL